MSTKRFRLDDSLPSAKPAPGQKWNPLFQVGSTKFRDDFPGGKISFTAKFLDTMLSNAKKLLAKGHHLQVNYHHDGGTGVNENAPLERTIASGRITDVKIEDGWFSALFDWTARAKGYIDAGELLYLSPEFALGYSDRDTGKEQGPTLLGAALTNTPFLKELPRVAANDNPGHAPTEKKMDLTKLIAILKLSATATEADVEKALTEMGTTAEALTLSEKNFKTADEIVVKLGTQVVSLSERVKAEQTKVLALTEQIAKTEQAVKVKEAGDYVDGLVKTGKILPPQTEAVRKLALSDMATAKAMFDNAKPVLEFKEVGIGTGTPANDAATAQSRLDAKVDELRKADAKLSLQAATVIACRELPDVSKVLFGTN